MFWMFIGFFRLNWQNFTCNKVFFSLVEEIKLANILEISCWFLGKHLFVCHSRLQQFKITAIGLKNCSICRHEQTREQSFCLQEWDLCLRCESWRYIFGLNSGIRDLLRCWISNGNITFMLITLWQGVKRILYSLENDNNVKFFPLSG